MFDLENVLVYAAANIQTIGIFIAIIGGLIASKLLNLKIEKDTLIEKLKKINKEIEYNTVKKSTKEKAVYLKRKEDYMSYIYDKVNEEDFNVNNYDSYDLTEGQRIKIANEVKMMIAEAYKIFEEANNMREIENILNKKHIQENTVEYQIYEYVGHEVLEKSNGNGLWLLSSVVPQITSFQESLEERDLNEHIDELSEIIKWKQIEKEDIEASLYAFNNNNLRIKQDVILFILITLFAIIIPQIVISIYPLFVDYEWFKYLFASYSIVIFIVSMYLMLKYIYKLFLSIAKEEV